MKKSNGDDLLRAASNLDATTISNGNITKSADEIVNNHSDDAVLRLYKFIIQVIDDDKYSKEVKTIAISTRESLIQFLGYQKLKTICSSELERLNSEEDEKTLEELLGELNELVGLDKVKSEVNDLVAFQKVQKLRKDSGLRNSKKTLHMAFMGNPGTGKTSVARIVGRIYKQLGILSKGHFLEVSRTDLIAGYQGQTALKVKNVIESIKGGVLFIDEAYSITENDHSDSYGRECLTELTKALEDYRDDLVVIVAGYTEPMKDFFASNPGLLSRFNKFIYFDDYSYSELFDIFNLMCKQNEYLLSPEAENQVKQIFIDNVENKDEKFANGRFARNLFEDLVMNHARRVSTITTPSTDELKTIILDDVQQNEAKSSSLEGSD